jgi:hypothetical protein
VDDATLTTTICQLLADANGWAWRPDGPAYSPAEVGLYYGPVDTTPDRAVGVAVYAADDDLSTGLAERRVQVWHRGAKAHPGGADELAGATFSALQGIARISGIALARRFQIARMGTDGNARTQRADSYLITLDNPEALT